MDPQDACLSNYSVIQLKCTPICAHPWARPISSQQWFDASLQCLPRVCNVASLFHVLPSSLTAYLDVCTRSWQRAHAFGAARLERRRHGGMAGRFKTRESMHTRMQYGAISWALGESGFTLAPADLMTACLTESIEHRLLGGCSCNALNATIMCLCQRSDQHAVGDERQHGLSVLLLCKV